MALCKRHGGTAARAEERIGAGTSRTIPRFERMLLDHTVWLAFNEGSGSNNAAAHKELDAAFAAAQCELHRRIHFPKEAAPDKDALEAAGVDILVVFAGDGTINSIVSGLSGWSGAVLVLPGGTMNLLSHRLHGDADAAEIVSRVAQGSVEKVRPTTLRSRHGVSLTGMLAGPGTSWNNVREALRETDVVGVVASAREAIGETTQAAAVVCRDPAVGRSEGYAAMMLTPLTDGIELKGYYADNVADYLKQGVALLRRNFRDGPHEVVGTFPKLRVASVEDEPIGLLIDGEPSDNVEAEEEFVLGRAEVDFLATTAIEPS